MAFFPCLSVCLCMEVDQCSEVVTKNYESVQCKRMGKYYCMDNKQFFCKKHLPEHLNVKYVGKGRKSLIA